jgi:hypothetical protein
MTDTIADAGYRMIEFVCDACLHSTVASDTGRWPRCPRCGIKLTPDDLTAPQSRSTGRATGRPKGRPAKAA